MIPFAIFQQLNIDHTKKNILQIFRKKKYITSKLWMKFGNWVEISWHQLLMIQQVLLWEIFGRHRQRIQTESRWAVINRSKTSWWIFSRTYVYLANVQTRLSQRRSLQTYIFRVNHLTRDHIANSIMIHATWLFLFDGINIFNNIFHFVTFKSCFYVGKWPSSARTMSLECVCHD